MRNRATGERNPQNLEYREPASSAYPQFQLLPATWL